MAPNGLMALIAALCGAVGFFAREPASKYAHLWDSRDAIKQDTYSWACKGVKGQSFTDEITGVQVALFGRTPLSTLCFCKITIGCSWWQQIRPAKVSNSHSRAKITAYLSKKARSAFLVL